MNAKKFVALLLVMILAFTLVSCGSSKTPDNSGNSDNTDTSSTSDATESTSGNSDQIIIGKQSDAAYLEPNAPSIGGAETTVISQIFEGLVKTNEDSTEIVPSLATDWTISEDGLVYTFNLKPDIKFSNGEAVTGEDWEWSLLRARDTETSAYNFIAEAIDTVQADEKQVVITLKYPWAPFLADLTNFNMVVGSKALYDKIGEEEYLLSPIGTGPYMIKEWKKEEYILIEANPNYHIEGMPKTKEIKFLVISDDNTRFMQLQAGQIDLMDDVPFSILPMIEKDSRINLDIFTSTQIRYLILNTTKAPFDDPKVRTAIYTAMNKQEISDLVAGEYGAPVSALVSGAQGKWSNSSLPIDEFDPEATKAALADAGYTDPIKFTLSIASGSAVYEQIATLLKSELDQAGFDVTVEQLEKAALTDKFQSLSHEATILQWVDDINDPSGIVGWTVDYSQCQSWYTGLNDEALNELNKSANREMDETKRVEMYQEIQQKIYDNANVVPLFRNDFAYASSTNIKNLSVSPFKVLNCALLEK